MLKLGAVRSRIAKGHSQAHAGVSGLNPLTHRNTGHLCLRRSDCLPTIGHWETTCRASLRRYPAQGR
jgi:hypothetical protein